MLNNDDVFYVGSCKTPAKQISTRTVKLYQEQRERQEERCQQALRYQEAIAHSAPLQAEAIKDANEIFRTLLITGPNYIPLPNDRFLSQDEDQARACNKRR